MSDDGSAATSPLSDRLSITALAISLIALIIGFSSFLQAILGTAEGYRQCAASVIGPWSKLRHRVFRWSEFRYETRFQAPLIKILTTAEFVEEQSGEHAGKIYLLNEKVRDASEKKPPSFDFWHPFKRYEAEDVLQQSLHLPAYLSARDHQQRSSRPSHSYLREDALGDIPRKHITRRDTTNKGRAFLWGRSTRSEARDTQLVSWIRFMHELHVVCGQYWPDEACAGDCYSTAGCAPPYSSHLAASLSTEKGRDYFGRQWDPSSRTKVAVIMMEWTWDFMPADVTRPLAYMTLGHVVILALRLGMKWRTLDRMRSHLSADGNGRSITSTDIRGLGVVLTFNTTGQPDYKSLGIIPSRAADKLMCGIVPGDADLVARDFALIDGDRKLIELWEPNSIYAQLGLDEKTSGVLKAQGRWETHTEVVTLLCSFLPLPGSRLRGYLFPAWKTRQYSIFHFFEPRLRFLTLLRDMKVVTAPLTIVLDTLEELSKRFGHAFYTGYVRDKLTDEECIRQRLELTEFCARAYRETTIFFTTRQYNVQPQNLQITWYMQLVAAHARLSAHVHSQTKFSDKESNRAKMPESIRKIMDGEGIETSYFAVHLWAQVQLYVTGLDDPEHGVVQYMQDRGFEHGAEEIRDAWWMLMLRGILWDLSCDCHQYPGEPVVSSYFSDETPVWFT